MMVGQLSLTLWVRNEKDPVMWRILRVGIWSIAVNEGGMGKCPGVGQNLLYLGNWKKMCQDGTKWWRNKTGDILKIQIRANLGFIKMALDFLWRTMGNSWEALSWRVMWPAVQFLWGHSCSLGREGAVRDRVEAGICVRKLLHLFWQEMMVAWIRERGLMFMVL